MEAITPLRVYSEEGPKWGKGVQVRYYDIHIGKKHVGEILAIPVNLRELVMGFLFSNAYIEDPSGVEKIRVEEGKIVVEPSPELEFRMEHMERGKIPLEEVELRPVVNGCKIKRIDLLERIRKIYSFLPELPHAAVLKPGDHFLLFEGISQENSIYRVVGRALLDHLNLRESVLLISEILTPDTVVRAAYMGIPVLGTLKFPTDLAVQAAENLGLTVFGLGVDTVHIYSHPSRIQ